MARSIADLVRLAVITVFAIPFIPAASHLSLRAEETPSEDSLLVHCASGQGPGSMPPLSPDTIIVKYAPSVSTLRRYSLAQQYECRIDRSCDAGDFQLVGIPQWTSPQQMVEVFGQHEEVEYAELNYYARLAFVPDDTFYSYQWNLNDPNAGGIGMQAAWDIQRGDPNVIVAIVDTGVAYEDFDIYRQAPDLAGTLFVPGYDFVNDDSHPNDDQGHGTHVAGTIAQSTNNNMGVAGVAFGCSIMPVKVLDQDGTGDYFTIASGILFAVANGARVINLSLGGTQPSRTLRSAVKTAYERGVTVVCAAGNGFLEGNAASYPAAEQDYCIAVGAIRYDRTRAPYSNTGSYISLVAPGGDLQLDQNNDRYADGILQQTFVSAPNTFAYWFFQGTSMAAPHVSGVAALLASRGVTQPDKIREAIKLTAVDLGTPGWDEEYGWGLVDAFAALEYTTPGDLGGDNVVDARDLLIFSRHWLQRGAGEVVGDLNGDRRVDLSDFALLAADWGPIINSVSAGD